MTLQHANITDPRIHEPKGASTAAEGTVYVADGLGSGAWRHHNFYMQYVIEDASTAGPTSYWIVVPINCLLVGASVVVNSAFSVDQTINFEIATVLVTGGPINLVASDSGAGDIFSCTITADNEISAGAALEIVNTGGSASPFIAALTLNFVPLS